MDELTDNMVTRCLGRHLIDLPAEMKPRKGHWTVIEEVEIEVVRMSREAFNTRLNKRRVELERKHIDFHPERELLSKVIPLPNATGVIFDRAESGLTRSLRTLELHGWKEGYSIKMTIDAYDMTYPEDQDDAQLRQMGSDIKQRLDTLTGLFARIRGRANDEIPNEPGICFLNGFVRGPATDAEHVDMGYFFPSMPDVELIYSTDSGVYSDGTTLLDRGDQLEQALESTNGYTIRKGSETSAPGLQFEEWLVGQEIYPEYPGYSFTLEINGAKGGAQAPMTFIDLWIGQTMTANESDRRKPSLSEAEAVALWDAITDTLRRRPGGF